MERGPKRSGPNPAPARARLRFLLQAALAVGAVAALGLAHRARQTDGRPAADEGAAPSVAWVDPATARVTGVPDWADPRWLESLQAALARQRPFALEASPTDQGGAAGPEEELAALRARLERFSFVRAVVRCEADPEGGLELELELRQPVACIPVHGPSGAEFALVAEDGVVLEGTWPVPPRLGRAHLPVIGPMDDDLLARARAGDWLVEPEHLDALDVALALERGLGEEQRAELGRVLVDARTARRADVAEPGVRLELEGGRVALFGRAPSAGEPGELGTDEKLASLVRALELYHADPLANDWTLVDLRWDRPEIALRGAVLAAAEAEPARGGGGRAPEGRAREAARSRVR